MFYPARFVAEEEGGFSVFFRDVPEALSCGDDLGQAREMAADALLTALDFYFEDGRPVPAPSALEEGEEWVALPASACAKVLLWNQRLAQKMRHLRNE